jgi:hypothetical protein
VYRIVPDAATFPQVAALSTETLSTETLDGYAELLATLEVAPWSGPPHHPGNSDGAVRRWSFGLGDAGQVVYLVLEDRREVHLLVVQWLG